MKAQVAAFSRQGGQLALKVQEVLNAAGWEAQAFAPARFQIPGLEGLPPLAQWIAEAFKSCRALVVVGSCGLAVRLIAPCLEGKDRDPGVVVLDETGRFTVALLSGHLGGANALAELLARQLGAQAVVTTATDRRGLQAIDLWAAQRGVAVENPGLIKEISGLQLEGGRPLWFSPQGVAPPRGFDAAARGPLGAALTERLLPPPFDGTLWLRPPVLALGLGCRRGTSLEALKAGLERFMAQAGYAKKSLAALASVDLKAQEPGLLTLAQDLALPIRFFSPEQLRAQPGTFSHSPRVLAVAGVDCVCERAAVALGGTLVVPKWAWEGMTFALASLAGWYQRLCCEEEP